ncbi:MAG: hypothetical protein RBT36_02245 [Desulfobulbus sp.]|nr:hypothetical protein [Desulfobulbus sp.]
MQNDNKSLYQRHVLFALSLVDTKVKMSRNLNICPHAQGEPHPLHASLQAELVMNRLRPEGRLP